MESCLLRLRQITLQPFNRQTKFDTLCWLLSNPCIIYNPLCRAAGSRICKDREQHKQLAPFILYNLGMHIFIVHNDDQSNMMLVSFRLLCAARSSTRNIHFLTNADGYSRDKMPTLLNHSTLLLNTIYSIVAILMCFIHAHVKTNSFSSLFTVTILSTNIHDQNNIIKTT